MLVAAEKGGVRPLICINKVDLVDPGGLQPLVGVYAQMGYEVLFERKKRLWHRAISIARWRAAPTSWPGRAAWENPRC